MSKQLRRSLSRAEGNRFGAQGQFAEDEKESGWNQFELRMWDGRIGRWMTPDPANQHYSPYMAYSNNPIRRVDPDGGTDEDVDPKKAVKQFLKLLPKEQRKQFKEQLEIWQKEIEDFDWAKVAVGFETSLTGSTGAVANVEGSATFGNVIFLGGEDAGFVYRYGGKEGGIALSTNIGLEGQLSTTSFLVFNHTGKGGHEAFAGEYEFGKLGIGASSSTPIDIGGALEGQVAISDNWSVLSFGANINGGLGASSPADVGFTKGWGNISFKETVGPKAEWQKIRSLHKLVVPLLY